MSLHLVGICSTCLAIQHLAQTEMEHVLAFTIPSLRFIPAEFIYLDER